MDEYLNFLLKVQKDPKEYWNINIGEKLTNFMYDINENAIDPLLSNESEALSYSPTPSHDSSLDSNDTTSFSLSSSQTSLKKKINFAKASLLLHGTSLLYSKRVDHLYTLVNEFMDIKNNILKNKSLKNPTNEVKHSANIYEPAIDEREYCENPLSSLDNIFSIPQNYTIDNMGKIINVTQINDNFKAATILEKYKVFSKNDSVINTHPVLQEDQDNKDNFPKLFTKLRDMYHTETVLTPKVSESPKKRLKTMKKSRQIINQYCNRMYNSLYTTLTTRKNTTNINYPYIHATGWHLSHFYDPCLKLAPLILSYPDKFLVPQSVSSSTPKRHDNNINTFDITGTNFTDAITNTPLDFTMNDDTLLIDDDGDDITSYQTPNEPSDEITDERKQKVQSVSTNFIQSLPIEVLPQICQTIFVPTSTISQQIKTKSDKKILTDNDINQRISKSISCVLKRVLKAKSTKRVNKTTAEKPSEETNVTPSVCGDLDETILKEYQMENDNFIHGGGKTLSEHENNGYSDDEPNETIGQAPSYNTSDQNFTQNLFACYDDWENYILSHVLPRAQSQTKRKQNRDILNDQLLIKNILGQTTTLNGHESPSELHIKREKIVKNYEWMQQRGETLEEEDDEGFFTVSSPSHSSEISPIKRFPKTTQNTHNDNNIQQTISSQNSHVISFGNMISKIASCESSTGNHEKICEKPAKIVNIPRLFFATLLLASKQEINIDQMNGTLDDMKLSLN